MPSLLCKKMLNWWLGAKPATLSASEEDVKRNQREDGESRIELPRTGPLSDWMTLLSILYLPLLVKTKLGTTPLTAPFLKTDEYEEPDTPAPVFAARALKSAIFGTPNIDVKEEAIQVEGKRNSTSTEADSGKKRKSVFISTTVMPLQRQSGEAKEEGHPGLPGTAAPSTEEILSTSAPASPTKLQGILLTPGTVTRRKTVSFGEGVVDNEGRNAFGRSGLPNNCPGKFPSPWTPRAEVLPEASLKKTSLMQSLESARQDKRERTREKGTMRGVLTRTSDEVIDGKSNRGGESSSAGTAQNPAGEVIADYGSYEDTDYTIDLNEPHSQSGKYWKSTFEQYHEEAQDQMRRLVKYKQLAKSYAKKKDGEAIDLGEKLKEEQQKVVRMEARISELAAQMANEGVKWNGSEIDPPPRLLKELTRHTALAVQYRNQVEEFKEALEKPNIKPGLPDDSEGQKLISSQMERTLRETSIELKKAREELKETSSLRTEISNLRRSLSAEENRASSHQAENERLSRALARANADLERSEKRRHSAEILSQKREEALQDLQGDYNHLKEQAKSQRREAEQLLKQRHDQVSNLKKEVKVLKSQLASADSDDPRQTSPTEVNQEDQENDRKNYLADPDQEEVPQKRDFKSSGRHKKQNLEKNHLLGSRISIPDEFQKRLSMPAREPPTTVPEEPSRLHQRRSSSSALTEVVNNAKASSSASGSMKPRVPSLHVQERSFDPSLAAMLPSPEPSLTYRPSGATHDDKDSGDKNWVSSPRPSVINLDTSARALRWKQSRPQLMGLHNLASSSRLSSLASGRGRAALPPDRAAAAKARLERRMVEKKKAQAMTSDQKENVRAE